MFEFGASHKKFSPQGCSSREKEKRETEERIKKERERETKKVVERPSKER